MRRARLFFLMVLALIVGDASIKSDPANPASSIPQHPSPPVDLSKLPWENGETLTYLVSWEELPAAQGTFVAEKKSDHWEFHLNLASRGVVNTIYPFTGDFWSILAPDSPWRSVEYGEFRFEPRRIIKERTRIDYVKRQGTREIWEQGKSKTFPISQPGVDDVGTMLYHLRALPWNPGDKRTFYVYETNSEKQGEAECQARETRAFGSFPAQPMLRISVLPTVGTHKKGHLLIWMTDDARHLPLHAELEFKYGTFEMDLASPPSTASTTGK
jgi:hypothetical protein